MSGSSGFGAPLRSLTVCIAIVLTFGCGDSVAGPGGVTHRFIFVASDDGPNLMLVGGDGIIQRALLGDDTIVVGGHFDCSPAGNQAVLVLGFPTSAPDVILVRTGLHIMSLDGDDRFGIATEFDTTIATPRWSPDGTRIAFWGLDADGRGDIFIATAREGFGFSNLTQDTEANLPQSIEWAPDGSRLLYMRETFPPGGTVREIVTINVRTRVKQVVARGVPTNANPGWSRGGTHIVYDNGRHVVIINADGTEGVEITTGEGEHLLPQWSPTADRIAYWLVGDGIHTIGEDGSGDRRVSSDPAASKPQWSPDGQAIAFHGGLPRHIFIAAADGSASIQVGGVTGLFPRWCGGR